MEQKEKKAPTEAEIHANFDKLLRDFNNQWDTNPKDLEKFESIKQRAKMLTLYPRQLEAIVGRCNNVINGTYGNTKKGVEFKAQ